MFLDFTLTKGGSFVYCEDASDYDENLPMQQNPEEVQAVQQELSTSTLGYGMVKKVQVKTLAIYQKINELFNEVKEEPASPQDIVLRIDKLKSFTSTMFNELRMISGKAYGVRTSVSHEWSMQPVINNMNKLATNRHIIEQSKYSTLSMQFQYNGLSIAWDIARYINNLIAVDTQDFQITSDRGCRNKLSTFSSWTEFLESFYSSDIPEEDPRFTSVESQSSEFSKIIEEVYCILNYASLNDFMYDEGFNRREVFTKLMNFNSIVERRIMINLHNLYTECMLEGNTSNYFGLVNIVMELRNAFIVNLMFAIGCAYETEIYRYAYASYAEYVTLCLATIDEAKLG